MRLQDKHVQCIVSTDCSVFIVNTVKILCIVNILFVVKILCSVNNQIQCVHACRCVRVHVLACLHTTKSGMLQLDLSSTYFSEKLM